MSETADLTDLAAIEVEIKGTEIRTSAKQAAMALLANLPANEISVLEPWSATMVAEKRLPAAGGDQMLERSSG